MASQPKILVFGATGNVGKEVSSSLIKRKVPFRAIVHTASKGELLKKEGAGLVEIVEADITNQDSIAKVAQGIEVVFLMTPPGFTHHGKAIGGTLKKAGVKRVVNLAGFGAAEPDKFWWAGEHLYNEQYFDQIGLPYTSLRPSSFHSNWFRHAKTIKEENVMHFAAGDARMNFISNYDIGEVAAVVLTTNGHEGKIYNITGPDNANFHEATAILSEVLGRKITYVPLTPEENRKQAEKMLPPQAVEGLMNACSYLTSGAYDVHFDDLEKLTGSKGRSLKEFFTANADVFK